VEDQQAITALAFEALRRRITQILPAQIRSCVEQLDEDQLWWRPNEKSNSVGNLVLHVRGSTLHFLYRGVGGFEYDRDRAAEFAEHGPVAKQELLGLFDEMVEKAKQTFASLSPKSLGEPSRETAYYSIVFEDLLGIVTHLATHTGQILYVTKMLKEGALDELWSQTHRKFAAWKS
jgi:hypothetical protein